MEIFQKIIREYNPIVKEVEIPSKSELGTFHKVVLFNDGKLRCDCAGGCYKKDCRHKLIAKEQLKETEGWRWNL